MALLTAGDKTSIVLIGMRGAGKTTYGKLAAKELGYVFVDLDVVMEDEQGCSCADVVKEHGWDGFRNIETQILKKQVEKHPELAVIACGGGVVENEEARKFLQLQPCVVSVNCPIDDIIAYLSKSATSTESKEEGLERRPNYGEEIQDVWNRRKPWFAECSNRDFYWKPGDDIEEAGKRFFYTLKNVVTPNVVMPNAAFIRHQGATSQSFQGNDAIYVTSKLSTREEAMTLFGQIRSLSHLPIVKQTRGNQNKS